VTTLTTVLGGLAGTGSAVGFGTNEVVQPLAGVIDITGLMNVAFSMPRDGTITSMSAFASVGAAVLLVGSTVTLTAQLYESTAPDNTFTPVPGAVVTLAPPLTGLIAIGATSSGTTSGLAIPVTAGTRLLLVFSAAVTAGIDIATVINALTGAGVAIQ